MINIDFTKPIKLKTSRAWRTYIGGKLIDELHGKTGGDTNFPEEWLVSTVCARNSGREDIIEGISFVDGTDITLKQLLEENPTEMLGEKFIAKHGHNTGVLVKLLDSAERLTVQVHPTKEQARKLFDSDFGKTEAWHILDSREINGEKPCLYIGFKEGITRHIWETYFNEQNIEKMLDCLHRFEVKKGDTFIIRGGVPHAIGSGCFLVEIQEPTDYTIRTERVTPSGLNVSDFMCHQGLGFDRMFDCFDYEGVSYEEAYNKWYVRDIEEIQSECIVKKIIYPEVTDMFSLEIMVVKGKVKLNCNNRFSGIYVISGRGRVNNEEVKQSDHFFIPAKCGDLTLENENDFKILRFWGPEINI